MLQEQSSTLAQDCAPTTTEYTTHNKTARKLEEKVIISQLRNKNSTTCKFWTDYKGGVSMTLFSELCYITFYFFTWLLGSCIYLLKNMLILVGIFLYTNQSSLLWQNVHMVFVILCTLRLLQNSEGNLNTRSCVHIAVPVITLFQM